jgi:hypothetical protein
MTATWTESTPLAVSRFRGGRVVGAFPVRYTTCSSFRAGVARHRGDRRASEICTCTGPSVCRPTAVRMARRAQGTGVRLATLWPGKTCWGTRWRQSGSDCRAPGS